MGGGGKVKNFLKNSNFWLFGPKNGGTETTIDQLQEAPGRFSPNTFAVHHLHFLHTTHIKITTTSSSTTPATEQGTHCSSRPRTDTAAAAPDGRTADGRIHGRSINSAPHHFYEWMRMYGGGGRGGRRDD
ncbi:hypothetical protein niasHS_004152 [Heterodera schachtii]|uniref:Uncharacterized protein n=1 Tax=Heterodera schachtii TaxID=97005 RepID=A0ABD2JKR8_HETSC